MREFDRANLKHPTFKEEHGGVTAIIPREIFMSIRGGNNNSNANNGAKNGANGAKSGANDGANDAKNGANVDAKNGANVEYNLTERQKEIINLIKSMPTISPDDIAKKLSVGSRTIDREVKKLSDIIKRVGPRNGGHWEIIEP